MPTRLFDLFLSGAGEMSASGLMLRIALAACSMFAMIHLLSLWGTRYGDNHTLSKSFFLSLVFHGCFCLGWATVAESYPRQPAGTESFDDRTPITFADAEDVAPEIGTNKLPVWHSGPAAPGGSLSRDLKNSIRTDRDDGFVPDVESPQIDKAPEMIAGPDMPAFTSQIEEQAPDLEQSTVNSPNSPASIAANQMPLEQSRPEAQPEVAPSRPAARASISRPIAAIEASPRSQFSRGASMRVAPYVDDGLTMNSPYDVEDEAQPRPVGRPTSDLIHRAESPHPAPAFDSVAGSGSDGDSNVVGTSKPQRSNRMSRNSPQTIDSQDEIVSRPSRASSQLTAARVPEDRMLTGRGTNEPFDDSPQPSFVKPAVPSMPRAPARAPETYQARSSGQRMSSALKDGGSDESEHAVESSLKWMASVQESDGRWSAERHGGGSVKVDPQGQNRVDCGKFADTGITGLVVLSFLGAGYTHEHGPYTRDVRQALEWLISQQTTAGYLGGEAKNYDQNYCHAIATFALAEAYAMQKDANEFPQLRTAVRRGVKYISQIQNEDGGWRYGKGESDMSMFGWQLMALKSAVNAGIPVPEETRRGMVKFLGARGLGVHGGLAGYKKDERQPTPAMTAEALFCRQMFAVHNNDSASQEAVAYLRRNLPRVTAYDEYYWYYGTLAMHNVDDDAWQEWNRALRDMLVTLQRKDGPQAGSWDPRGKWAGIGGRLYSTALSTMCLEVYYRYQSNVKPAETH